LLSFSPRSTGFLTGNDVLALSLSLSLSDRVMQELDGMALGASRFSAYRSLLYLAERVVGEVWTFCWELDLDF
jgi:hypothetical protein